MRSGTRTGEEESHDGGPEATETIERHLRTALDASESSETRFHLRQALQLVHALK